MWFCLQEQRCSIDADALSTTFQAHLTSSDQVSTCIDEEENCPVSDEEPSAALAFKIMTDPFVGRLTFFRVYSGVLQLWFLRIEHF